MEYVNEYKKVANSSFNGYSWTGYCAYNNFGKREEQLEIPQVIHYCWFGGTAKNEETKNYIDGWKKVLKGYEFKEWNEFNFPVEKFSYAQTAYEKGEYASVNDVARTYALYTYGGIYLNTDMEVIRDFSGCLRNKSMVLGFEKGGTGLTTGFAASVSGHEVLGEMLDYYREYEFVPTGRECPEKMDVLLLTNLMMERGVVMNNRYQQIEDRISVFPEEYFGADRLERGIRLRSENTYTIHHYRDSEQPLSAKIKNICRNIYRNVLGIILGDESERKIQIED